jgi:hypothetical protein
VPLNVKGAAGEHREKTGPSAVTRLIEAGRAVWARDAAHDPKVHCEVAQSERPPSHPETNTQAHREPVP